MKKLLSAVLCTAVMAAACAMPSLAQGGVLGIDTAASESSVEVGDEFYVDFVVTDNDEGFNNITGMVRYNADVIRAVEVDDSDEPSDRIIYNKNDNMAILFPYNVVNSRIGFVPKSGDSDYDGKADGSKTAAEIGIVKYSGFLSKSTNGYLDNYEGTGTLLRMKFKAIANGSSDVSFDILLAQSYQEGKPNNLNVDTNSVSISVGDGAVTEATTAQTTAAAGSAGGGSGSAGSSQSTTAAESTTEVSTALAESTTEGTTAAAQKISFSDVPNDFWGAEYIYTLANRGVISGYADGSFKPNAQVKRADFIIMLLKGIDVEITAAEDNFTDVEEGAYYANAVGTAKAIGLATGNGDGTFSPNSNITRQDMMILAKRALEYKSGNAITGSDTALDGFSDKAEVSAYAVQSLAAMVENEIVSGSNGQIMPKATTTRAQAAVIINKLADRLSNF